MITLNSISYTYPGESEAALRDVSLTLGDATVTALVGPNGSGKTTLMRALLGMVTISAGRVRVNGAAPGRAPRGSVGYVPQLSDLDPTFPVTVREVVQMGMYSQLGILRRPGAEARRRALEAPESVGLADRAERRCGTLSGGQQQRVAIARAMVNRPKLLLADEPTGNLDPSTSVGIMRLLDRINRQGTTVVMATHDDEIVDQMRKRVIELKGGEVVRDQDRGVYGSDR